MVLRNSTVSSPIYVRDDRHKCVASTSLIALPYRCDMDVTIVPFATIAIFVVAALSTIEARLSEESTQRRMPPQGPPS